VNQEGYRLEIAGPAARALAESLPPKVAAAAYAFITGPLLENPRRVGKPLEPPLAPAWSARRGAYRILYIVDERLVATATFPTTRPGLRGTF
jgi:mRNA-degrading endonuclease RelE of RelBE toxin-antitoxin system